MEECNLRLHENRVLRRIFGLQRDVVGASLSIPLTPKKNEMGGKWAIMGDRRDRVVVEKGEGRVPLEDLGIDVRIILKLIIQKESGYMGWIDLAQDRGKRSALVKMLMNLQVP
jgi:hypothetical protein